MTTTKDDIEVGMKNLSTNEDQFDSSSVKPDYRELEANSAKSAPKPYDLDECSKCIVIIEGLPKVDEKKEEKLLAILTKNIFIPSKAILVPCSISFPRLPESSLSQGYMFAEFATAVQANSVIQIANGYKLDKSHVLFSYSLHDAERVMNGNDNEEGNTFKEEAFVQNEFFNEWLCDPKARDQFLTLVANGSASISWGPRGTFGSNQELEKVHNKASWADVSMQWSSSGSLLASLHKQGIMLWAGESFKLLNRFPHPHVRLLTFSPKDRYMLSWSPIQDVEDNVMLWDTKTARLIRSFKLGLDDPASGSNTPKTVKWPIMKFNADDTIISRRVPSNESTSTSITSSDSEDSIPSFDLISYSLPSMTALKDRNGSIRIENVSDFEPSPSNPDHLLYWTVGTPNIPSRLTILSLKDLSPIKSKNIFNVLETSIHFQNSGTYCAIIVKRHIGKNKNKHQISLEIVNFSQLSIETMDLIGDLASVDGRKISVSWEPNDGHRFLLAITNPSTFKTDISFYSMKGGSSSPQKLADVKRNIILSSYHWSPKGDNIVLMGSENNTATLEFFSLLDMSTLVERDHFCAAHGAWDPSGRFFASYSSILTRSSDNGYILWDLRGELLIKNNISEMVQFAWRPRPPTLLGKDALKKIKQGMMEFSRRFEESDMEEMRSSSSSSLEEKSLQIRLWNEWRRHCIRDHESRNHERRLLIGREMEWEIVGEDCLLMEWREDRIEEVI